MKVIKIDPFQPNFKQTKRLTLWKLFQPNDFNFTAEPTVVRWEKCPYANQCR